MIDILSELTKDLNDAAKGIADNAMIERGAKWIQALRRENPVFYNFIESVLYKEPRQVLIALAVLDYRLAGLKDNEYAQKYVRMIQKALKRTR